MEFLWRHERIMTRDLQGICCRSWFFFGHALVGFTRRGFFDSMFLTRFLLLLLLLLNSCPLFCEHFFALLVIIHLAFVIIYLINLAIKRVWHSMRVLVIIHSYYHGASVFLIIYSLYKIHISPS